MMKRTMIVLIGVLLLLTPIAFVSASTTSPLTNPNITWDLGLNETTLGLPWYSVSAWEVSVCTQGLSSMVGSVPSANDVTDMSLSTPIYMDTITLLAKKSPYNDGVTNGYYYEVGWYVQPFQGQMIANVILYDSAGGNYTLQSGTPTDQSAFDGYVAFPVPCDPAIYTGKCVPVTGPLTSASLEWWSTNGTNNGPIQHLTAAFILVNETNG